MAAEIGEIMGKTQKNRRGEIMDQAAILFHKKGFVATSIRDISAAMGMESASLYNHIKSKQEILQVLLMSLAEEYVAGIQEIELSTKNPLEKLEAVIAQHIKITIENTDAVSLIPSEWVHLDEGYLEKFMDSRNSYERSFLQIMDAGVQQKHLKPVNVRIAAFSILSTLRFLYSWYSRNKDVNPTDLETELLNNLLGGLKI